MCSGMRFFSATMSKTISTPIPNSRPAPPWDSSLLYGIETLCDNKRAFVNCTREVLFKDLITLFPPSQTVAEILETVEPEDRVIAACKRLKAAGYLIALDDFAPNDPRPPLCEFAPTS
jgi:c-di-GMP-related signal transduction protein